jgi:hypothetical protein
MPMKNILPVLLAIIAGAFIAVVSARTGHSMLYDNIAQVQCSGVDARGLYFRRQRLGNGTCQVTYSRGSDNKIVETVIETDCPRCS